MRIIYSFNTGVDGDYFRGNNLENNFLFYELSIKLCRQYYPVTLYTDELGAERLGHLVDDVIMLEKDPENYIWSEPKFEAISRESGEFLHVDGDLWIDKPFTLNDSDIYYDHTEDTLFETYYKDNLESFTKYGVAEVFPEWRSDYLGAFNIGILGFRTDEIKHIYLDRYFKMKEWYYSKFPYEELNPKVPSMTLGEHSLSCLSDHYQWKSTPLFDEHRYLHMYSARKHIPMFVTFVKNYLDNNHFLTYKENGHSF